MEKYKALIAVGFILLGGFMNMFGGYYVKVTIMITSFWTTVTVILFALYVVILPTHVANWASWTILLLAVAAGCVVSCCLSGWVRLGAGLIGVWAGCMAALIFYQAVI